MGLAVLMEDFSKGMHHAKTELGEFKESIVHVAEALAVMELAAKAFETIKGVFESAKETEVLAQRLGLGVEAFGQLTYVAKTAKISQEELGMSLSQMTKRLGEVATGAGGPAAKALERFGLDAGKLAEMGTDKALETLLRVIREIGSPMERSAIATELFGKKGFSMINIALKGADAIKEMRADASRLGFALDEISAAKLDEATEGMERLSLATQGWYNMIAVQVAPAVTLLLETYLEWAYSGTKSTDSVTAGMGILEMAIAPVLDAVHLIKAGFLDWQSTMTSVVAALTGLLAKLAQPLEWFQNATSKTKVHWKETLDAMHADLKALEGKQLAGRDKEWGLIGGNKGTAAGIMDAANARAKLAAEKSAAMVAAAKITEEMVTDYSFDSAASSGMETDYSFDSAARSAIGKKEKPEHQFAGALEVGSKEAYSATLKAQGLGGDDKQQKLVSHTLRAAVATEQTNSLLREMVKTKDTHAIGAPASV